MKLRKNANQEYAQNVELKIENGRLGLEFESQGGNDRNNDYSISLIAIIGRLKSRNIKFETYYNSNTAKKNYLTIDDRRLNVNYDQENESIKQNISREMIRLGGANNSCLFIYSESLGHNEWMVIVNDNEPILYNNMVECPEFDDIVDSLIDEMDYIPDGDLLPEKDFNSNQYKRNPYVKARVLKLAHGACEYCERSAPFIKENNKPYLEVHHVKSLADGGSDRVQNAIAVCPNCHRMFHYGRKKDEYMKIAIQKIERLVKE